MLKIYHNPRCSKSRGCLAFLEQNGEPYEIVKYLDDSPTIKELTEIIGKLGLKPIEVVRQNENIWIEKYKDLKMTEKEVIEAMVLHPILIERPIAVNGDKAVIARPLERISEIM